MGLSSLAIMKPRPIPPLPFSDSSACPNHFTSKSSPRTLQTYQKHALMILLLVAHLAIQVLEPTSCDHCSINNGSVTPPPIKGVDIAMGVSQTHLFFVGDAILFSKASLEEFYHAMGILNHLSRASGQRVVNILKSSVVLNRDVQVVVKKNLVIALYPNLG